MMPNWDIVYYDRTHYYYNDIGFSEQMIKFMSLIYVYDGIQQLKGFLTLEILVT